MNGLALCSGIGGIELGLRVATGGRYRTVCHVEWEGYAASALVARMDDAALDRAPIWDDLESFDGEPWRGIVDCITAGLPCQPYSDAGAKVGNRDRRALWPELVRIVEEVRPAVVFLENVPRFLKFFEPVYVHLRALGFEFSPPLLHTAAELGAPHGRRRLFVLAADPSRASEPGAWDWLDRARRRRSPGGRRNKLADTSRDRLQARDRLPELQSSGSSEPDRRNLDAANADGARQFVEWSGWVFDRERQTLRHDVDRCGSGCRICGTHWEAESPVLRVDARPTGWMDELRTVGNAVAPDVVASAWRILTTEFSGGTGDAA